MAGPTHQAQRQAVGAAQAQAGEGAGPGGGGVILEASRADVKPELLQVQRRQAPLESHIRAVAAGDGQGAQAAQLRQPAGAGQGQGQLQREPRERAPGRAAGRQRAAELAHDLAPASHVYIDEQLQLLHAAAVTGKPGAEGAQARQAALAVETGADGGVQRGAVDQLQQAAAHQRHGAAPACRAWGAAQTAAVVQGVGCGPRLGRWSQAAVPSLSPFLKLEAAQYTFKGVIRQRQQ